MSLPLPPPHGPLEPRLAAAAAPAGGVACCMGTGRRLPFRAVYTFADYRGFARFTSGLAACTGRALTFGLVPYILVCGATVPALT
eukprot:14741228-Alexandrium_andersonii.AAC.1